MYMCVSVSHLPSPRTVPAVWHHYKLHMNVAWSQAEKLRAGRLPSPTESHHKGHAKATPLFQCHKDRDKPFLSLQSGRQRRGEEGAWSSKRMTPILGPNTLFPAIDWEFSAGTSCHHGILMPRALADICGKLGFDWI